MAIRYFAIHFPTNPRQQDTPGKRQANDREQLLRDSREKNPQHNSHGNAPEDDLATNFRSHLRCRHTDHDGVVPRQSNIDQEHLDQLIIV